MCCTGTDDWEADGGNAVGPKPFSWTRGTVEETRIAFLRNLGVGYGYNAVSGRYCNYADIRCQILNRRQLERAEQATGELLWQADYTPRSRFESQLAYNEHDYVATFNLGHESSINCIVFKEEQVYRQNILEDGLRQSFYYSADEYEQVGAQWIDVANTRAMMDGGIDPYQLLTRSFTDAVEHLAEADNPAAVDSFINVYGTHVIVRSVIGGRLHIDLKNDMKRYSRLLQEEAFSSSDLLAAFNSRAENRTFSQQYAWMENSALNITVYGGDQGALRGLLGVQQADGSRALDLQALDRWRSDIAFVPDDEYASNAEMIDMEVVPIWQFMFDVDAATKVRQHIQSSAAAAAPQLNVQNFFSCSFPVRYENPSCFYATPDGFEKKSASDFRMLGGTGTHFCVLVVSGGRFVAMVCREWVGGQALWVAYPIYDGVTKLYCGLGVDDEGQAYHVRPNYTLRTDELWAYGSEFLLDHLWEMEAEPIDPALCPQTERFYINNGELALYPMEGADYQPTAQMLYCEAGHSVDPQGKVHVSPSLVQKMGTGFIIYATDDEPQDFVGWTSLGTDEYSYHVYRRNDDFVGFYNPTEFEVESEKSEK